MTPTFKELADGLIELKKQAYPFDTVRINASHINRILEALERADRNKGLIDIIKLQASGWAMEARTQKSTVHSIYQLCSEATGEKGSWNGSQPVAEKLAELKAERDAALERAERLEDGLKKVKAALTTRAMREHARAALKGGDAA